MSRRPRECADYTENVLMAQCARRAVCQVTDQRRHKDFGGVSDHRDEADRAASGCQGHTGLFE